MSTMGIFQNQNTGGWMMAILALLVAITSTSSSSRTTVLGFQAGLTPPAKPTVSQRAGSSFWAASAATIASKQGPSVTIRSMAMAETSSSTSSKEESPQSQTSSSSGPSSGAEKVENIDQPPPEMEEGSHKELMYTLGVNLARQLGDVRPLVENGEELAQVAKGLLDTVIGRLTEDGQRTLLQRRGEELNTLIVERANEIKERLAEAGREMLATMEAADGAVKLDSGVVLHILEDGPEGKGQGVRATQSSTVKIHYHGTLSDGTVFDTTIGGDPVTFPLAGVIPGWRDGVLKMHEGETAMLGIPPAQAYGEEGTPDGRIPGGSTLFFKIQLLEVMSAGIGGGATLLGADGNKLKKGAGSPGLLGPDGKAL